MPQAAYRRARGRHELFGRIAVPDRAGTGPSRHRLPRARPAITVPGPMVGFSRHGASLPAGAGEAGEQGLDPGVDVVAHGAEHR